MRVFGQFRPRILAYVFFVWFFHRQTDIYIYITRSLDWTSQCGACFARPIIICNIYSPHLPSIPISKCKISTIFVDLMVATQKNNFHSKLHDWDQCIWGWQLHPDWRNGWYHSQEPKFPKWTYYMTLASLVVNQTVIGSPPHAIWADLHDFRAIMLPYASYVVITHY